MLSRTKRFVPVRGSTYAPDRYYSVRPQWFITKAKFQAGGRILRAARWVSRVQIA